MNFFDFMCKEMEVLFLVLWVLFEVELVVGNSIVEIGYMFFVLFVGVFF